MKKWTLLVALLFLGGMSVASAQDSCEVCKLIDKPADTILLTKLIDGKERISEINFQFLDRRQDTMKIGYAGNYFFRDISKDKAKKYEPVQLEHGTAKGMAELMARSLTMKNFNGKKANIVGILKKCWISNHVTLNEEKGMTRDAINRGNLVFSADYFLEKDGVYHAFARIDTILPHRRNDLIGDNLFEQLMNVHEQIFTAANIEKTWSRKGYSLDFIKEKNRLPLHPIQTAAFYKRGIYQTFDEFLANAPGMPFKELKDEQRTDVLYTESENGEVSSVRKAWGFSDGKKIFIKLGFNFFRLAKVNGAFEFIGFDDIVKKTTFAESYFGSEIGGLFNPSGKYYLLYFPMQVNMADGTVQ